MEEERDMPEYFYTNFHLGIAKKTPMNDYNEITSKNESSEIKTTTTAIEVAKWVNVNEFSSRACGILSNYNGEDLLNMKPIEVEELLGPEEGYRLASMLGLKKTAPKNESKFASELRAILERRKKLYNHNPDEFGGN